MIANFIECCGVIANLLLWDLTAQLTKKGGTTIGLVYCCSVITDLFEDYYGQLPLCGFIANL
jgi:hypothetical protein